VTCTDERYYAAFLTLAIVGIVLLILGWLTGNAGY
jgi:hypothetical protein